MYCGWRQLRRRPTSKQFDTEPESEMPKKRKHDDNNSRAVKIASASKRRASQAANFLVDSGLNLSAKAYKATGKGLGRAMEGVANTFDRHIDEDEVAILDDSASDELLALDEALEKLAQTDKIKADLVKLRYFAGLPAGQAAEMLGISRSKADELWAYARAWLRLEIEKGDCTPKD